MTFAPAFNATDFLVQELFLVLSRYTKLVMVIVESMLGLFC